MKTEQMGNFFERPAFIRYIHQISHSGDCRMISILILFAVILIIGLICYNSDPMFS